MVHSICDLMLNDEGLVEATESMTVTSLGAENAG